MGRASSAKKIARMAQKGKGKKIRFQHGTTFPVALGVIGLALIGLILYARGTVDSSDLPPRPRVVAEQAAGTYDHWHVAFGVYNCSAYAGNVVGEQGVQENRGVHSHDDGVIHYHPFDSAVSGKRATLGKYFDTYGIEASSENVELPASQGGLVLDESAGCDGKDAKLQTVVWNDASKPDTFYLDNGDPDTIRIDRDGMAIALVLAPDDFFKTENIVEPPSAANLAALGAADGGAAPVDTTPITVTVGSTGSVAPSDSVAPVVTTPASAPPASS